MFAKVKTRTKILGGFGIAIAITAVVAVVGYQEIRRLSGHVEEIGAVQLPSVEGLFLVSDAQKMIFASENVFLCRTLDIAGASSASSGSRRPGTRPTKDGRSTSRCPALRNKRPGGNSSFRPGTRGNAITRSISA